MGLQTSNDILRKYAINTTCTTKSFERAVSILLKYNYSPAAFVLIKAPFLTNQEAKLDALNTLAYLDMLGVKNSTLCPMRISEGTLLKRIYDAGLYSPLNLWVVVDILKEYDRFGTGLPMVNTTELKQFVNEDSICAYSCEKCNKEIIYAIEQYLFIRDVRVLEKLSCSCRDNKTEEEKIPIGALITEKSIYKRINDFYANELENKER
jgi:hypothetical protein